jgi:Asp-tRNA(Asn)/Glu-tRNA(Gln) amidotransferase A subunit family amidase
VWEDQTPVGDGHSPKGFMGFSNGTNHAHFKFLAAYQATKLRLWNSYFDTHQVDLIMVPGQMCDAITYAGLANAKVPKRIQQADGSFVETPTTIFECNIIPYFAFKDIPVPKVMVPTGLDKEGRPTGVQMMGRGPDPEALFDDAAAATFDLPFLYAVQRAVAAIHKAPALQRQDASQVTGNL